MLSKAELEIAYDLGIPSIGILQMCMAYSYSRLHIISHAHIVPCYIWLILAYENQVLSIQDFYESVKPSVT